MTAMGVKENIFFMAGFPRSGTTWFASILNAHSKIIYRHEIIGRNFDIFGDKLFDALKYNHGLSDEEFAVAIKKIAEARVDTDKPPFFPKSEGLLNNSLLHHYAWLTTKAVPPLSPLYRMLFSTKRIEDFAFLIKETRSTANMDSMIAGLRPKAILFLVRQPHGAIASSIKGVQKGTMGKVEDVKKTRWFASNHGAEYVQQQGITEASLMGVSDVEFLAIQWRVYHDDLKRFHQQFANAHFYFYDDFVATPEPCVEKLLTDLGLEHDKRVFDFLQESSGKSEGKKTAAPRDASDEYYSVYRNASFDPNSWSKVLSEDDVKVIEKHAMPAYESLRKFS